MSVLETLIYPTVDEFQPQVDRPIAKEPQTPLVGPGAVLDSLLFVSFILAVEDAVEAKTGKRIALAGEKAMSMKESPFRSLATLAAYVEGELALAA